MSLSKNKEEILQLAEKGQIIEKPKDLIKDPYILEFLGLSEKRDYSENDLESEDKSEALVQYTLPENNEQIFASKYFTVLPQVNKILLTF